MEKAAFIIIENDSILTEKYYNGYDENSVINSFSMAKTLIYVSLAKAIEEGYIKSLEQKVVDFIPELKGEFANEVRVPNNKDKIKFKKIFKLFSKCAYNNNIVNILVNIIKIIGPDPE